MPSPTSPSPTGGLTAEQLATFERDGYLIIPNALTPETVNLLLEGTNSLLDSFSLADHPMTKFSTGEKSAHVGDDYFLTSGDKIRFFFEEDAFSPSTGELTKPKARAINKIGHYLHRLSPPFASLLEQPAPATAPSPQHTNNTDGEREAEVEGRGESQPAAIARSLGFKEPRCLQSMVICKQPEIGGAVPPHQDSTFLYTNPPSAVGFWYALEDATAENGCLSFLPGSHRWAPISQRFVRAAPDAGGTTFTDNDGPRFPEGEEYGKKEEVDGNSSEGEYRMGEVRAGTLVLIHGNLLHKSEKNMSQRSRFIYTFHVIEGRDARYDKRNWLHPPDEGFTRLYR